MTPQRSNSGVRIDAENSRLSVFRLSVALLVIGAFWMTVQLHAYVVWLRGAEKALLLVAVIASCIAIYVNEHWHRYYEETTKHAAQLCCIITLCLVTSFVAYLIICEPSPVSREFDEIPGARSLKLEGIAISTLVLAPLAGALAGVRVGAISRYLPISISAFCAICLLCRFMSLVYYLCGASFPHTLQACHVGLADIGGTTLNAIHAVEKGINPYTIDVQGDYTHDRIYPGYRYWPVMFAAYMPLVSLFTTGWGAMRLTNFALDVITAILIVVLARRRSGWLCGVLAASLYLMLPMLPMRLYQMVDTDLVPTVLLLAALALYQTRPGAAGVMVGLSVSAKIFPGLLMLVCCLPEVRRLRYFGGFALGLVPAAVFCLLSPRDFIHNTVMALVHFTGTALDSSSWQYGASFYLISATRLVFILLMTTVSLLMIFRPPGLFGRCSLYVVCVVATLLVSHAPHNNYMLWWIPFFCILLSSPLFRILSRSPGSAGQPAAARGDGYSGAKISASSTT